MALVRFSLDLAIPLNVYNAIPTAQKLAVRDRIRELKAMAVKINAGQPSEEMTVRAKMHICRHDEGKPCDTETDI